MSGTTTESSAKPDDRDRVTATDLLEELRRAAFAFPEAWEDHPWGESVAKVGKKVFVFFGSTDGDEPFGFSVKLPISNDEAALPLPSLAPARLWARSWQLGHGSTAR